MFLFQGVILISGGQSMQNDLQVLYRRINVQSLPEACSSPSSPSPFSHKAITNTNLDIKETL